MSSYEDLHGGAHRPKICPKTGVTCSVGCVAGHCIGLGLYGLPKRDDMDPEVHDLVPGHWEGTTFVLPTDSEERKKVPLWGGLFRYFPDALAEVARLSYAANEKHNPGQAMHWNRHKSMDQADCLLRHQLDVGTWDHDGFLHDVKVAWRALAQLQLALERLKQGGRR